MAAVAELRTAHTADLDPADFKAARALLDEVFNGEVTEADWEHALGGVHALVWDGPALIGHGSVIQRRLLHQGRALRAGYVEAVAVRADRQGQGHGAALMSALERVLRGAYDLGARLEAVARTVLRTHPGGRPADRGRGRLPVRVRTCGAAGPGRRADLRLAGRGRLVAQGRSRSAKKAITRSSAARVG